MGYIPFGYSKENSFPCLFYLPETISISWLMTPSTIFKASRIASSNVSLTLTPMAPSYEDPDDYIGHNWLNQTTIPISQSLN